MSNDNMHIDENLHRYIENQLQVSELSTFRFNQCMQFLNEGTLGKYSVPHSFYKMSNWLVLKEIQTLYYQLRRSQPARYGFA
jgi:hypothetical protein